MVIAFINCAIIISFFNLVFCNIASALPADSETSSVWCSGFEYHLMTVIT